MTIISNLYRGVRRRACVNIVAAVWVSGAPAFTTTATAASAAYYVATNGNDSNPGTLAQPFLTAGRAQFAMRSSAIKTAFFRQGVYAIGRTITLTSADDGETYAGYPSDPAQSALLQITGAFNAVEIGYSGPVSNIAFANLTFDGGSSGGGRAAIFVAGNGNGIHIKNNKFQNLPPAMRSALFFYNSDNVYFQGNVIVRVYQPVSGHLTDDKVHSHIFMTDNTLSEFSRMGLELQNNSDQSIGFQDVHVDRNTITTWARGAPFSNDIAISFVTATAAECNTIWGNTFYGTTGTGAWAIELNATNTSVESNVMVNIDYPIFFSQAAGSEFEHNTITNTKHPYNEDGGYNAAQWVGVNTINGALTTGWAAQPNTTAKPAVCAPSSAMIGKSAGMDQNE